MFHNRLFGSRFRLSAESCRNPDALASHIRGGDGAEELPLIERKSVARQDQSPRGRKKSSKHRPQTTEAHGSSEGLCSNCENRMQCTMRSQEGGVWHCEEYR